MKTIADQLDANSAYMGIAYAHLNASHSSDYMGYAGHAARSSKIIGNYLE